MLRKFGRLPRARSPRVPHLSALRIGMIVPPAPPAIDYTSALPVDLGEMLNDVLQDCTCAAVYHAIQVWSANAQGSIDTEPDSNVLDLYKKSCGYSPADPSSDQGGVEQEVLGYLLNTGALVGSAGQRQKISAFVEVDPRQLNDVRETIYSCGVAYIGFDVPGYLMAAGPPALWDVSTNGDQSIRGSHAVVLAGYDEEAFIAISWGQVYRMSLAFFAKYIDEVYAIATQEWVRATGLTPCGISLADLETQMEALKAAA